MGYSEIIELAYDEIIKKTDEAILFDFGEVQKWIPKSLIEEYDKECVIIPLWFAEKEELEGYEI